MSVLKYGDSYEKYGRNKGGRFVHLIRGGRFIEGQENLALCFVDITKPATQADVNREICWHCEDRAESELAARRELAARVQPVADAEQDRADRADDVRDGGH